MTKPSKNQIPDSLKQLLSDADKQRGFPMGTMASLMQQEVGGQAEKYLADPAAYHYAPNAEGKRVAGHTGKVSTAFGPFGILESTGADPGYGVKPLQDKSIGEQVRFAADYLQARSKGAGGLVAGLAGYGEGTKYAQQVMSRVGAPASVPAPVMSAPSAPTPVGPPPVVLAQSQPDVAPAVASPQEAPPIQLAQAQTQPAVNPEEVRAWQDFLQNMPQARQPVNVADLQFGEASMGTQLPQFQFNATPAASLRPNFGAFGTWGRRT